MTLRIGVKALGKKSMKVQPEHQQVTTKNKQFWVQRVCLEIKKMIDKVLVILKNGDNLQKETLHDWCEKAVTKLAEKQCPEIVEHVCYCLWKTTNN
jgi:hypothetical protein